MSAPSSTTRIVQWVMRVAIVACALTTGLVLSEAGSVSAGESVGSQERVEPKSVTGTVSGIGSGYIAVEVGPPGTVAAEEMGFPLDEKARTLQRDALTSIGLGDTVAVDYRQTTTTDAVSGAVTVKRVAMRVSLLSKASPQALEPVVEETP